MKTTCADKKIMKHQDTYGTKEVGKPEPRMKWQRGHYASVQDIRLHIPYSLILLCKLWGTTPRDVLIDFMDNLSHGGWKRANKDAARQHLRDYVSAMNYGIQYYSIADVQQMFRELDAIGLLWPDGAKMEMIERHAQWRDGYYEWWFKKWMGKYRRKE
jgi:hypothetical protein